MERIYNEIRKTAEKYHIDKIVLFGSRARGDFKPKSDFDIAVYFKKGYYDSEWAKFSLEIEEDLPTLYSFDVICVNEITSNDLLKNIHEDGVVIYMSEKKFEQYKKAVMRLNEVSLVYKNDDNEFIRDSLIQRFEFTFELAWKTLKEYLEYEGFDDVKSPKSVLQKAFSVDIINSEQWNTMLEDRNKSSHIYKEETAIEISDRIINIYIKLLNELTEKLEQLYNLMD